LFGGCKRFKSGHGNAGTVLGGSSDSVRWYGGVLAGTMLASARYRYANAIATPVFPILCSVTGVVEMLSLFPTV